LRLQSNDRSVDKVPPLRHRPRADVGDPVASVLVRLRDDHLRELGDEGGGGLVDVREVFEIGHQRHLAILSTSDAIVSRCSSLRSSVSRPTNLCMRLPGSSTWSSPRACPSSCASATGSSVAHTSREHPSPSSVSPTAPWPALRTVTVTAPQR